MDPENKSGLIDQVMRAHGLYVTELRDRIRVRGLRVEPVHVHGRGWFECPGCPKTFASSYSWLTVDLIDQMVTKKWTMKCKECETKITPTFELEGMVERACRAFKQDYPVRTYRGRGVLFFSDPHCSLLCEKCSWGKERCWRSPRYVPPPGLLN